MMFRFLTHRLFVYTKPRRRAMMAMCLEKNSVPHTWHASEIFLTLIQIQNE